MTQLIRRLSGLARVPRGGVITIGNFDGVHAGHQALLQCVIASARAEGGVSIVLTFEPQPREFFSRGQVTPRLTDWRQKFRLLARTGVDVVVMVPFDAALAEMSAGRFMQAILQEGLGVRKIVTGGDFRFGCGRQGTVASLQANPAWVVEVLPDHAWQEEKISSTRIREALQASRFKEAAVCLGRPWSIEGRVVYGEQRGRQLGFPTANILLRSRAVPVSGVYAVRVCSDRLSEYCGVANVGVRPTVDGRRRLLEVHLFRFSDELYGKRLEVEFCHKLREECRFASLDALKEQIGRDVRAASDYFIMAGNRDVSA